MVGFRVGKGEGSRAGLLGVLVRAIGATSRRSSRLDALALLLYSRATFSPSYLFFPLFVPLRFQFQWRLMVARLCLCVFKLKG